MHSLSDVPIEELLSDCLKSGDLGAWQEFVRRYHRPIARVVFRMTARFGSASPALVDDLVQETYLRLCADDFRSIREFVHRHPEGFTGYLKVIAANIVRDHFKSERASKRSGVAVSADSDVVHVKVPESDPGAPAYMDRSVLLGEVQRHLDECVEGPDRERNLLIFWLYYRTGLTAAAIASMPEVCLGQKGVESTILRLTKVLRLRLRKTTPSSQGRLTREGVLPAESF